MSRRSLNDPLALQNPCRCETCRENKGETWPIVPEGFCQGPPRPPEMQGRAVPIFAPGNERAS